jgi:UDP-glucose 4-epimerase
MTTEAVLVTGGAGYIGSHVALALIEEGYSPVIIDDLSTGSPELVPAGVPFYRCNAADGEAVAEVLRRHPCQAVMHFAGSIVVPQSVAQPLLYYRNNTATTRNLVSTCLRAGIGMMVFSSTAAVYGNPARVPIAEAAPTQPINPYGRSKLMTEWMLADIAAAETFRYVALRYFNVAGADPQGRSGQASPEATHLIKVACETLVGKRPSMAVFGTDYDTEDGTCVRDYIHVCDLARAHVLALRHLIRGGDSQILNCGYGQGYSVRQVIRALEKVAGRPINAVEQPRRPGDPARLVADARRIRTVLDWVPMRNDLDAIVADALRWEQRRARP